MGMDAGQGTYTIYISQGVHNNKIERGRKQGQKCVLCKSKKNTNKNSKDFLTITINC